MMTSVKKFHFIFKKILLLFLKLLRYLVSVPSFKLIKSSSLSRKNIMGIISFPHPIRDYEVKIRR